METQPDNQVSLTDPIRNDLLVPWGIGLFVAGLLAFALGLYLPSEVDPAIIEKHRNFPELLEFDPVYKQAVSGVKFRIFVLFLADNLLPGGFFMWLTGCIIRSIQGARSAE